MNRKKITLSVTNIIVAITMAIVLLGVGYQAGKLSSARAIPASISNSATPSNKNIDFTLFWNTWNQLEQKYVDKSKLNTQKMFYGAIKGMVASVEDPYTFFLSPEENKESKNDLGGMFHGIGAQLGLKENRIVIVAPIKGSPAEAAGVQSGDHIVKVDNVPTTNWTLNQAVTKIRGPKGTKVTLTLERAQKEVVITIMRDEIYVSSVDLTFEDDIAHLRLNQFGDNTHDEWDKAVDDIVSKYEAGAVTGMVLDLRDNPGGYLEGAVYLASEFLPQDSLIVEQQSTTKQSKKYFALREGRLLDIPLVVLINKGSASASEILAGALRDYNRAKLVGEKSFGKGSVQEAMDLEKGAGIHITVAKWLLPKGEWINGKGLTPQVTVANELKEGETITRDTDTQLDKAVEELRK